MDEAWLPNHLPDTVRRTSVPALPLTLGMLVILELFCLDPNTSPVEAHIAGSILFCTYSCMRFAQAQYCWLLHISEMKKCSKAMCSTTSTTIRRNSTRGPFWARCVDWSRGVGGGKVARTLGADVLRPMYATQSGVARKWVGVPHTMFARGNSFSASSTSLHVELLVCHANRRHSSWVNIMRLYASDGRAEATTRSTISASHSVVFNIECSVDSCVGCADNPVLQAKCFAAQESEVEDPSMR